MWVIKMTSWSIANYLCLILERWFKPNFVYFCLKKSKMREFRQIFDFFKFSSPRKFRFLFDYFEKWFVNILKYEPCRNMTPLMRFKVWLPNQNRCSNKKMTQNNDSYRWLNHQTKANSLYDKRINNTVK